MSDILIRGMEMPKDCGKCFVGDRTICADGCVLIELPEHGDLIDRNALPQGRVEWDDILDAPVVISATKGESKCF